MALLPMPEFTTARLRLRRFTQADLDDVFEWAGDEEVARYVYWPVHKNKADTQWFIDFCLNEYAEKGIGPWAVEHRDSNKVIGNCSYGVIDLTNRRIELAYFFARPFWGQGLAVEAIAPLLKFGFEDLRMNRIEARCMPENRGSERVMQKSGMSFEGILRKYMYAKGRFHTVKVYSLLASEWFARK